MPSHNQQIATLGTVLYDIFAVLLLEEGPKLFYFFAKRRQELNAAKVEAITLAMNAADDDEARRNIWKAAIAAGIPADKLPALAGASTPSNDGGLAMSGPQQH